ncbi:MAG: TolC family protein [Saprospiraceae bacterium]|nr:TolC family protein [Saprospiraceae bacterium]
MKSYFSPFVVALVWIFVSFGSMLSAQQAMSLEDAVAEALQNNFQNRIAKVNQAIAENSNHLSFAGGLPIVNFGLNATTTFNRNQNPASFLTEINTYSGGINPTLEVLYTLYNGKKVKYTMDQLSLQQNQTTLEVQNSMQQTVYDVTLAYYGAVIQSRQLAITKEVIGLSKDRIKREEARQEYGQGSSFDILQTTDAFLIDSSTFLSQKLAFENAKRNLLLTIGANDYAREITLTDDLNLESGNFELNNLVETMLSQNPTYQQLILARELAAVNTNIRRADRLPTISLRGSGGYNYNNTFAGNGTLVDGSERDFGGLESTTLNGAIALNFSFPIYDGGLRKKQVQNAAMSEMVSQLSLDQTRQQLTNRIQIAYNNFETQKQLAALTTERINNAKSSLDIATERFNAGQINSFDYRAVQISYLSANQVYLNALFNLKNAYLDILLLTGELINQ